MGKIIWEFRFPQDRCEFENALNGGRFASTIWNLYNDLRGKLKYGQKDSYSWQDIAEEALRYLREDVEKIGEIDSYAGWLGDEEKEEKEEEQLDD